MNTALNSGRRILYNIMKVTGSMIAAAMAAMAATGLQAQYVDITNALYPERYEQNDTTHHPGDDIIIKSPTVLKYVEQRDSLSEAAEQTVKVEVPQAPKAKAIVPSSKPIAAKRTNTKKSYRPDDEAESAGKAPVYATSGSGNGTVTAGDYTANMAQARQGDATAQYVIGQCYLTGAGVERNVSEAWKWLARSAEQGNENAQFQIGQLYDAGIGVSRSDKEAAYWYRRAARNGHVEALLATAKEFELGRGVLQDKRVAAENYWRAAERGSAQGAYNFAIMLRDGVGVQQDLPRALKYFMQAAVSSYSDAAGQVSMLQANGVKLKQTKTGAARKKTGVATSSKSRSHKAVAAKSGHKSKRR